MKARRSRRWLTLLAASWLMPSAWAATLVINTNASDPAPRAAWDATIRAFEREHPEVSVRVNAYDHESYKRSIRNWLTGSPPDVIFWFAGNRMRQFVVPGLLADVSDLFTDDVRRALHPSVLELASHRGRQYGVPYTTYPIGFFYRRDLVAAPRTWADLIASCDQLNAKGVEPIAIGTKNLWPAAAWFDYIDLRENGYAFHMALMDGRVPYTDRRVREVFARWRELLERRCFSRVHASSTWQESQALVYQGRSAMMLMGTFVVSEFPPEVRDRIAFAAFPSMREGVPRAEEAPVNTLHIPARARNRVDALKFLAFVLRKDVQQSLNRAMLQIPAHLEAAPADDRFLQQGRAHLAGAAQLTQYFDRDTSEDLALVAMNGFQEFMLHPERLDAVLETIERARVRIYGKR